MHKPFSEACERNKQPILDILSRWFAAPGNVLEIGSGTGQHSVHICQTLQHLLWQPSEISETIEGTRAWVAEAGLDNLLAPIELDLSQWLGHTPQMDYLFTANTIHFVSWPLVENMVRGASKTLPGHGKFAVYGPFNENNSFTSVGNQQLDNWIKSFNPEAGLKNRSAVIDLFVDQGLHCIDTQSMPANNLMLLFSRSM
ncbi:MAG: class I SAM-dependent methyltransferase [Pseudomonadales bacterium]|nr:class I SAM-dependent methyltransferase [Pseudomonadales bacterium]